MVFVPGAGRKVGASEWSRPKPTTTTTSLRSTAMCLEMESDDFPVRRASSWMGSGSPLLSSRRRIQRVCPFSTSVSASNPSGGVLTDVFVSLIKGVGLSALHTAEAIHRASPSGKPSTPPSLAKTGDFPVFQGEFSGFKGSDSENEGFVRKINAAEWKTYALDWKLDTADWKSDALEWKTDAVDWNN